MEIESWLTDVYGPRLTNSPNYRKAGDWAVKELTEFGLTNVKLEPWGPFGRGWSNDKFYFQALEPTAFPIIGYPKAGPTAPTDLSRARPCSSTSSRMRTTRSTRAS